eukprot:scaffold83283_cov32-Tisochrysis_lutea.AAC.2
MACEEQARVGAQLHHTAHKVDRLAVVVERGRGELLAEGGKFARFAEEESIGTRIGLARRCSSVEVSPTEGDNAAAAGVLLEKDCTHASGRVRRLHSLPAFHALVCAARVEVGTAS